MPEFEYVSALHAHATRRVRRLAEEKLREPEREALLSYSLFTVQEKALRKRVSGERRTQSLPQVLVSVQRKECHAQEFSGPRARDARMAVSGEEECSPAAADGAWPARTRTRGEKASLRRMVSRRAVFRPGGFRGNTPLGR